jgi:DNA-binding SARP family transcriptional activator
VAAAVEQLRAAPPPLAFSLLGDFAVRRGPWTLDPSVWQRPIAARLLRFLLLHREGPLPEDVIFEAFWPGKTPQAARHNLAVLVSQVRSALDIPGSSLSIIASADRTYLLDLGPEDSVDADEFDAAAAAALTMEGPERTGRLEHAAGLWHGEPLPQERYSEWTFAWRERLIDRYLQVLAALADGYLQAGDHGSAIRAGRAALALDPLNEAAHRSLMAAYARAGRIGHALRQYLECRRSLVDELGVEPSRATSALQARILGGAPV